jgi:hypothetical protein
MGLARVQFIKYKQASIKLHNLEYSVILRPFRPGHASKNSGSARALHKNLVAATK